MTDIPDALGDGVTGAGSAAGPGGIPIVLTAFAGLARPDPKDYHTLAEGNFTFSVADLSDLQKLSMALESAERAGIGLIIDVPAWPDENLSQAITRLIWHNAIGGYLVGSVGDDLQAIIRRCEAIRQSDTNPAHLLHLLVPQCRPSQTSQARLNEIGRCLVETPVDCIWLTEPARAGEQLVEWLIELDLISEHCRQARKNFWSVVASVANVPSAQSAGLMRLGAFASLAYGARGIIQPTSELACQQARELRMAIRSLGWVFTDSTTLSVGYIGKDLPRGLKTYRPSLPFTGLGEPKAWAAVAQMAVRNQRLLAVVNTQSDKSVHLEVNWQAQIPMSVVRKDGLTSLVRANAMTTTLIPGDILMLAWSETF